MTTAGGWQLIAAPQNTEKWSEVPEEKFDNLNSAATSVKSFAELNPKWMFALRWEPRYDIPTSYSPEKRGTA